MELANVMMDMEDITAKQNAILIAKIVRKINPLYALLVSEIKLS